MSSSGDALVEFEISYPDVSWTFAQQIYGWSSQQYQLWARGELKNLERSPTKVLLYTPNILEYWINNEHVFGGDFFGFNRAPLLVTLQPGVNIINLRLIRDVRAMGGWGSPTITVSLHAAAVSVHGPVAEDTAIVLPDIVDGRLPSHLASVLVRNQADKPITIRACDPGSGLSPYHLLHQEYGLLHLAPGQSRYVGIVLDGPEARTHELAAEFCFDTEGSSGSFESHSIPFRLRFKEKEMTESHKFTFLHPSGAVSYAILRPPSNATFSHESGALPILLNLHGAGLEADSYQVRHMLDELPDLPAWILFPTGMSPWSGDDWHAWGTTDVQAALAAIPAWIETIRWSGPGADTKRVLVSGHSNGGQGTWYYATHYPDRVLAAAPASGYSSVENYVPYTMWTEADPLQTAITWTARANFRHELLVENIANIPMLQQHGSADDNVPPYHSRLMSSLRSQTSVRSDYVELPGKEHWWEGAMTTQPLTEFYERYLDGSAPTRLAPNSFVVVYPNSDDIGSSIIVDQLESPDRLGRIEVNTKFDGECGAWVAQTTNIRRLHLDLDLLSSLGYKLSTIFLDDTEISYDTATLYNTTTLLRSRSGVWEADHAHDWKSLFQRFGRQRGALDAFMRTSGAFQVVSCVERDLSLAVQISRNMIQYFAADSNILSCMDYELALARPGNIITLVAEHPPPPARLRTFPITIEADGIKLVGKDGKQRVIRIADAWGVVMLRPLPDQRLELLVWGSNEAGLQHASRLVPTITGVGQPDFIVFSEKARWLGHAGTTAMGFFDYSWNISAASYVP